MANQQQPLVLCAVGEAAASRRISGHLHDEMTAEVVNVHSSLVRAKEVLAGRAPKIIVSDSVWFIAEAKNEYPGVIGIAALSNIEALKIDERVCCQRNGIVIMNVNARDFYGDLVTNIGDMQKMMPVRRSTSTPELVI
jgi:hypothetical protein